MKLAGPREDPKAISGKPRGDLCGLLRNEKGIKGVFAQVCRTHIANENIVMYPVVKSAAHCTNTLVGCGEV